MESYLSLLAALATLATAVTGLLTINRKLDHIHVLVNSRLSTALDELSAVKKALKKEEAK